MNPLTLVKRTQKINSTEAALGISEEASWHAKYKDSAYVFVGGISYDLTEGDLVAVFAQYGEVVDVNLVRDKGTGKSKGFAFLAYEDQRSTILAVDNLNGAKVLGRIVRVDHVSKYKKKEEEENDEKEQQKREARGVCRAFQRGDCNRGASCKFSHDEQRCANTGWGSKDDDSSWNHDKYDGPPKSHKDFLRNTIAQSAPCEGEEREFKSKSSHRDVRSSRLGADEHYHSNSQRKRSDSASRDSERRGSENISGKRWSEPKTEDNDMQTRDKRDLERRGSEKTSEKRRSDSKLEDRGIQMRDKYSGNYKSNPDQVHDLDRRGSEKRSRYGSDSSKHYHQEDDRHRSAHR